MNRIIHFAISLGLVTACRAQAMGSLADVAVIDRDSGSVLSPHYYRGEYWVAGIPGARYSIEIRNRMGERLLAVTAVDGVNVVSGASAAWDQTGYVFSPDEANVQKVLDRTSSGGVTVNGVFSHYLENRLPFGGVNGSGQGSYHGYFGFKAFSQERAVDVHQ